LAKDAADRFQQILDATLDVVADVGLLQASISKISKQATCSPGIIYHYFESKDAIMDTLYLQSIKNLMLYLLDDDLLSLPVLERYKGLWIRRFHFHVENHKRTTFMEQYKNSSYYTPQQSAFTGDLMQGLWAMGQSDLENGLLKPLPLEVINEMVFGVAVRLANLHNTGAINLDEAMLQTVADSVCRAVLA